jgi:hypothetical protein
LPVGKPKDMAVNYEILCSESKISYFVPEFYKIAASSVIVNPSFLSSWLILCSMAELQS